MISYLIFILEKCYPSLIDESKQYLKSQMMSLLPGFNSHKIERKYFSQHQYHFLHFENIY